MYSFRTLKPENLNTFFLKSLGFFPALVHSDKYFMNLDHKALILMSRTSQL